MIFYPQKQPKNAAFVTIGTMLLAGILYFIGDIGFGYRAAFQMTALLALAVGILILSRYILTDYKYIITNPNEKGIRYFIIIKVSGKREFEMAKFDISELYAYKRCRSVKEFEAENGTVDKIFNYLTNFRSANEFQMAMTFNGKKMLFRVDAEPELEAEIRLICDFNFKKEV